MTTFQNKLPTEYPFSYALNIYKQRTLGLLQIISLNVLLLGIARISIGLHSDGFISFVLATICSIGLFILQLYLKQKSFPLAEIASNTNRANFELESVIRKTPSSQILENKKIAEFIADESYSNELAIPIVSAVNKIIGVTSLESQKIMSEMINSAKLSLAYSRRDEIIDAANLNAARAIRIAQDMNLPNPTILQEFSRNVLGAIFIPPTITKSGFGEFVAQMHSYAQLIEAQILASSPVQKEGQDIQTNLTVEILLLELEKTSRRVDELENKVRELERRLISY